jgi:hypothetical protein
MIVPVKSAANFFDEKRCDESKHPGSGAQGGIIGRVKSAKGLFADQGKFSAVRG